MCTAFALKSLDGRLLPLGNVGGGEELRSSSRLRFRALFVDFIALYLSGFVLLTSYFYQLSFLQLEASLIVVVIVILIWGDSRQQW